MKKNVLGILIVVLSSSFLVASCSSKPHQSAGSAENLASKPFETTEIIISYKKLKVMDLDQMTDLMYEKLNDYKKTDRISSLREGLLLAYARPNEDGVLDKILSIIQVPLDDLNQLEVSLEGLVQQSINTVANEKASVDHQVTSGIILENILSDLKPNFLKQYKTGGFETEIVQAIAGSSAHYSKAATKERKLNLMKISNSPKELAERLMEIKNDALKQTQ